MNAINAVEAETQFASLLDRVEHGERITIARNGKPIAELVPVPPASQQDLNEVIRRIRELRRGQTLGGIDWRELRDEGRR